VTPAAQISWEAMGALSSVGAETGDPEEKAAAIAAWGSAEAKSASIVKDAGAWRKEPADSRTMPDGVEKRRMGVGIGPASRTNVGGGDSLNLV